VSRTATRGQAQRHRGPQIGGGLQVGLRGELSRGSDVTLFQGELSLLHGNDRSDTRGGQQHGEHSDRRAGQQHRPAMLTDVLADEVIFGTMVQRRRKICHAVEEAHVAARELVFGSHHRRSV